MLNRILAPVAALIAFVAPAYSQMAVVSGNAPGPGGTADYTVSGFGTPDAALLFVVDTDLTGAEFGGQFFSVGMTDFSGANGTQAVGISIEGSSANTDTRTESQSVGATDTFGSLYTISAITDGVRLTASGTPDDFECMIWLVKGDNAKVLELTSPSALNGTADFWQSSASENWLPDNAIVVCPEPSIQPAEPFGAVGDDASISLGFADWDDAGDVTQYSLFLGELDNQPAGSPFSLIESNRVVAVSSDETTTGASVELSDINVYSPPAFSDIHMTTRGLADDLKVYALIVDWPSDVEHAVSLETGPTSTGNWSLTPGFEPTFVGVLQSHLNASGLLINNVTSGTLGVFGYDGAAARSIAQTSEYNADPTVVYSVVENDFTVPFHNGTYGLIGSPSFSSTQFTINFTTVDSAVTRGRKWPVLLIGE